MTPKRSIIYDEIGSRFGKGKKAGRPVVKSPPGVSHETKRIALERAKALVVHRHFAEVMSLTEKELEFLIALDEWAGAKVSMSGVDAILEATKAYYEEKGFNTRFTASGVQLKADGSVQEPMLTRGGVKRPRPRQSV